MFLSRLRLAFFPLLLVIALAGRGATPEDFQFFEKNIRPLFVENCYKCHSAESEKIRGGLLLDTREGLLKGGENGPAIVPGDPEKSLLIKAVRYNDKDLQMPPKDKKLSEEKISYLVEWIKMGAPDPRAPTMATGSREVINKKAAQHWAFQPVKKPE